jgi:flagellar hook-associated protein 2
MSTPPIIISGLVSGLDTENLISQLIALERKPVIKLTETKTDLQTKEDAWRDVNTRLVNLNNTLAPLKSPAIFQSKTVASTNESVATATAGTDATPATYVLDSVTSLAKAHKVASDPVETTPLQDTFTDSTKLDLPTATTAYLDYAAGKASLGKEAPYSGPKYVVSVNKSFSWQKLRFYATTGVPSGTNITYEYSTDNGSSWTAIADPGSSGTLIDLGAVLATQLKFRATLNTTNNNYTPELLDYRFVNETEYSGTFTINGRAVTVASGNTSLSAVKEAINAAGAGVTAEIIDSRLVITSNITGQDGAIDMADDSSTKILQRLGILPAGHNDSTGGYQNEVQAASDAEFKWNGMTMHRTTNTITGLAAGLTVNLFSTSATSTTITVANNTQPVLDTVNTFVEQYNSTMDFIAIKMGKDVNDKPLELFGDPTIIRVQQSLKSKTTDRVAGLTPYDSLASIGITTTDPSQQLGFSKAGKLQVDSALLENALASNMNNVRNIFAQNSGSVQGVAVRLSSYVSTLVVGGKGIVTGKQNTIEQRIKDIDTQIARWEDRLALREEILRRQFTNMETVLSQLQAQSEWLTQQISKISGNSQGGSA